MSLDTAAHASRSTPRSRALAWRLPLSPREWAIAALVVAAISALAVGGGNLALRLAVEPPADAELRVADGGLAAAGHGASANHARPGNPLAAPVPPLSAYRDPILERSLFDSSAVGQDAAAEPADDGEQPAEDLGYELVLTSVAVDPSYSTALLRPARRDGRAAIYTAGDLVADAVLERIERRRVYVRRADGGLEYLEIGAEPDRKRSRGTRKQGRIDWKKGITKVDSTHFQLDREAVDDALANLDKLGRKARIRPKTVDGRPGYRIYRIRNSGPFKKLGLRNNDVIVSVNGQSLSDPGKALEMYGQLQSASSIEIEVVRRGKPMTLSYDIF